MISTLRPLDKLGRSEDSWRIVRDLYETPDHRFDPRLLADTSARAELQFIDSLVHGLTTDPVVNWSALAATALGRDTGSRKREWYLAWAERASQRLAWSQSNARAKPQLGTCSQEDLWALAELDAARLAKRLGLSSPPPLDATPEERRADLIWRRGLVLLSSKGSPVSLQDLHTPWVPFAYRTPPAVSEDWQKAIRAAADPKQTPLLVVEPYDFWSTADISALDERYAIFAFSSHHAMWHALSCDNLFRSLLIQRHAIVVGGEYPDEHVFGPWLGSARCAPVRSVISPTASAWVKRVDSISEAATAVLTRFLGGESTRNPDAQWFFELGLNLKHEIMRQRFGAARACTLHRMAGTERWFSPFKDRPTSGRDTHPPVDLLAVLTGPETRRPARRALSGGTRRRLVHIVSQVIDGGHAPSTLVRTLVERANRARWDISVVSLESAVIRAAEYPRSNFVTEDSSKRGARTIDSWRSAGVHVHLCGAAGSIDDCIREACEVMAARQADVAIWHGNDPSLLVCAARSDIPRRVFFEHSGLVFQPDFDLAIASLADAEKSFAAESVRSGVAIAALPYCSNARATWDDKPPDLKTGPNVRILTTISNHLENRVAGTFVEAVATILQICPNAIYAPIGPVQDRAAFQRRFAPWGVADRIMCTGPSSAPSQLCRGMHLYLNEFPFGSGIAILDAMAAGLPVVTMYDPNGPMQAQNGGNYIGHDRAIRSLDPVDYVTLACQLIQDPAMYQEWSAHSHARFECFGPEPYVRRFEEILETRLLAPQAG
ncbi:MAG: glycosyltransferase [Opitutaceae bacterium]|nr:glycosyltransferase [Opitutaceae bacterium]